MFHLFRIKESRIKSRCRNADIIEAKKIICYLYEQKGFKHQDIGKIVNLSSRGVGYSISSLKSEMQVNKTLANKVEYYLKIIL